MCCYLRITRARYLNLMTLWEDPGHFFSYNIGEPWETEYDLIADWEITDVVSEDPSIVSIEDESEEQEDHRFKFLICPKKPGTTNLICTSYWGNTKVIPVTVTDKYKAPAKFTKSTYTVTLKKYLYMRKRLKIGRGDAVKSWKVNKKSIASISKSGKLKAKKVGKVKVTAFLKSGKKATCTVKVVKPKPLKVYWTPNGSVYHKSRDCPTLSRSKRIRSGTIKQSRKRRCCKVCG